MVNKENNYTALLTWFTWFTLQYTIPKLQKLLQAIKYDIHAGKCFTVEFITVDHNSYNIVHARLLLSRSSYVSFTTTRF